MPRLRRGKLADTEREYRRLGGLAGQRRRRRNRTCTRSRWRRVRDAERMSAVSASPKPRPRWTARRTIDPSTPGLREARSTSRVRASPSANRGPRPLARIASARCKGLLAAAAEAEARGDLLTPPGDSAYDRLRVARSLAPNDKTVIAASKRLLPAAWQCYRAQLRATAWRAFAQLPWTRRRRWARIARK